MVIFDILTTVVNITKKSGKLELQFDIAPVSFTEISKTIAGIQTLN